MVESSVDADEGWLRIQSMTPEEVCEAAPCKKRSRTLVLLRMVVGMS